MFVYVLMSCFVYVLMFLCSYVQRPYVYMVLCSYVLDHSDTHVVAYVCVWLNGSLLGGFCIAASLCLGTHMELGAQKVRSRPDPLVGISALTAATLEAMCDLSFVMFSCLYICVSCLFSYV